MADGDRMRRDMIPPSRKVKHGLCLAPVLVWASMLTVLGPPARGESETKRWPALDRRTPPATALATPASAAERELQAAVPGVSVSRHRITGSPRCVHSTKGFLTGPVPQAMAGNTAGLDQQRIVKAFVEAHRDLFGHGVEELERAHVTRDATGKHNGLRTLIWEQRHAGIPVFDGLFMAHVTRAGELVNVASQFLPDPAAAVAKGQGTGWESRSQLTAVEALARAMADVGVEAPSGDWVKVVGEAKGAEMEQDLSSSLLKGTARLRLVWTPLDSGRARLAWEAFFMPRKLGRMFETLVDAETGAVWVRRNRTYDLSDISLKVFTGDSPTPCLPGYAGLGSNSQPASVARELVTLTALNTSASPAGWINDGDNETLGNNVDAHTDLDANNSPDLPRPHGSPARVFNFALDLTKDPSAYRKAAVVNLFYWCNWMHDRLYEYGFDEASGNFQSDNFGRGGKGGDAVQADAQDGSGVNNSNFTSAPDGQSGRLQMWVYTRPDPNRDADLDTTIILHEYTHGLSDRLVGGGVGFSWYQPEGMNEGWSDFCSLALLAPANGQLDGNYPCGAYLQYRTSGTPLFANTGDNYYFGMRRYPYSTKLSVNPSTFKDITPAQADPHNGVPITPTLTNPDPTECHHVGEVWCAMLWEARARLIAKHGYQTGNNTMLQLVVDGMKLSPADPSFVEARDAILQADQADYNGAHKADLWAAFAKRGLGTDALAGDRQGDFLAENYDTSSDSLHVPELPFVHSYGYVGGPVILRPGDSLTISNRSGSPLSWAALSDPPLAPHPAEGVLAPHGTAQVMLEDMDDESGITLGWHSGSIQFSNRLTHWTTSRPFGIEIDEPLHLVDASDQELGDQGFSLSGPSTGPFSMDSSVFLANESLQAMPWAASVSAPFVVSPAAGTVAKYGSWPVKVTVSPAALPLAAGAYPGKLWFTNLTTGRVISCGLQLKLGNDKYLTRLFDDSSAFDLADTQLTFTPDGSDQFYSVCRAQASALPTDPAGGTQLHHYVPPAEYEATFDDYAAVFLTGGRTVSLYGHRTNVVLVSAYGGVNFGAPDPPYPNDFFHFDRPRVSACFSSFEEVQWSYENGASISWKQQDDRFTVTWENMQQLFGTQIPFSMQVELFFNDSIRITVVGGPPDPKYLGDLAVGLSRGEGMPADFVNTDFLSMPTCYSLLPPLSVSQISQLTEGQPHPGQGQVSIPTALNTNLVVSLLSEDPFELVASLSVTIPAGATSASFDVTPIDDNLLNGTHGAKVLAMADGFRSTDGLFLIHDHENTTLHLHTPAAILEGDNIYLPHVSTEAPVDADVRVILSVDPPGAISFGPLDPIVIIPKGDTNSSMFQIQAPDNGCIDGPRQFKLVASVANWHGATNTITILDAAKTNLTMIGPPMVLEGSGRLAKVAAVGISGVLSTDLVVTVTSDWPLVSALGTVTIPAGKTKAWFDLLIGDDPFVEPSFWVTLTASAPGFASGRCIVWMIDNDQPPLPIKPSPQDGEDSVALDTILSWEPVFGELIVNGGFESLLGGWTREDTGAGGWVAVPSTYQPIGMEPPAAPQTGSFYALSQQYGNGTHTLWQQIDLPDSAWPLVLRWSQRVHNHAAVFATNQEFRVELRGRQGEFLATLYESAKGDPLISDWTNQVVNLWSFRGQTVRIALVEEDALGSLNVSLDDVSVFAGPPAPVNWLVYFGTKPTLDRVDFQGAMTASTLNPGMLAPNTTYYWRVLCVCSGMTNAGPVWSFTTAASNYRPPALTLSAPSAFGVYRQPTNLLFGCGNTADSIFTNIAYYADSAWLGNASAARAWPFTWTNPPPGEHALYAVGQDRNGLCSTSEVRYVSVLPTEGALMTLLPFGSTWSFFDQATNLGTVWREGFGIPLPLSGWKQGPAPLGYGVGDEATEVSYGRDEYRKNITTYFRANLGMVQFAEELFLQVRRQDGVAVYLNGHEVLRDNLSVSADYSDPAKADMAGPRGKVRVRATCSPTNLTARLNSLAAEVHLARPDAPAMAFDLELSAAMKLPPTVTWLKPTPNSLCMQPASLELEASAWDRYGSVVQVEFFADGASLGVVTNAPYAFKWMQPPPGAHTLKAVATDNQGATATSADNLVIVLGSSPSLLVSQTAPDRATLSWPVMATGYHLEFTTNLAPPVPWEPWTGSLMTVSNSQYHLILPLRGDRARYFRLAAP